MAMKLDRKSLLLGLLLLVCIAATIPRRSFFTTTTVDSAAWTTLGTNLVAQTTASAARSLLLVTNATGLEATDAHLVTVSNSVNSSVTAQGVLSNAAVLLAGTQTISGAKSLTNSANVFVGNGSGLTGLAGGGILTSNGLGTNTTFYSSGTTNRPATFVSTNSAISSYFDKDAGLVLGTNTASSSGVRLTTGLDGFGIQTLVITKADVTASGSGAGVFLGQFVSIGSDATASGSSKVAFFNANGGNGWTVGNGYGFGWNAAFGGTVSTMNSVDTHLSRSSAGVVQVTQGSSGTYRDLIVRSLYATNLYATNLVMGGGAAVTSILSSTASLDYDLTAVVVQDLTVSVTGAAVGDIVVVGVPNGSVTTTVIYNGWVSAANTVTIRARVSAVGENPASGTFRATVIRH